MYEQCTIIDRPVGLTDNSVYWHYS